MAFANIQELTDENICKLCDNALGRYSCPKCNILYCSLKCYQGDKHLECSEKFYRDNVMENLETESDETAKVKMMEILKRMHEENTAAEEEDSDLDSDDDYEDDKYAELSERLAGVNLDNTEQVWEKLTATEKREFEKFLSSEKVFDLVEKWQPWWLYHCDNKILDLEEFEKIKNTCPKIRSNIQDFSVLSKNPPSDVILYNIFNILGSYALIARYFNGECEDFVLEAVSCITKCSSNLSKGINSTNEENAIEAVKSECSKINWLKVDMENILLMGEDTYKIMQGPHSTEKNFYVLSCLSALHNLFSSALKTDYYKDGGEFAKAFPDSWIPKSQLEDKSSIKRTIKKIEFLLSYVKDNYAN